MTSERSWFSCLLVRLALQLSPSPSGNSRACVSPNAWHMYPSACEHWFCVRPWRMSWP
jgi:hypothetical protein